MFKLQKLFVLILFFGVITNSCTSTKLTNTRIDEAYKGKPFSDFLVIGVSEEKGIRRSFEEKFVEYLKETGVEALSSADAITIVKDKKLEKEEILKAVQKYQNDAVIITHLLGEKKKDVYTPPTVSYGYYGYYDHVWGYVHSPGYYTTHTFVLLETNLYDVSTEKLVWSGRSETWDSGSEKKMIDEVIKKVTKEIRTNGLLPDK
jgi:hypothetical protein